MCVQIGFPRKGVKRTAEEIATLPQETVIKRLRSLKEVASSAIEDAKSEMEKGELVGQFVSCSNRYASKTRVCVFFCHICPMSRGPYVLCPWQGQLVQDRIDRTLLQATHKQADLDTQVTVIKKFTSGILANPHLLQAENVSVFDLGKQFGISTAAEETEVMGLLAVAVAKDAGVSHADFAEMSVPMTSVVKESFFLQKTLEEDLGKTSKKVNKYKRKFDQLQKGLSTRKARREGKLNRALESEDAEEIKEVYLSKRNCRNRARKGIKKIRKARDIDTVNIGTINRKCRTDRLTIYQKMQIVNFANSKVEEWEKQLNSPRKKTRLHKNKLRHRSFKGMNLQRICQQRFPELGKIKVCSLLKMSEEQSWASLSEDQQKRWFQLPDHLKAAMGLTDKVKGWKALGTDHLQKCAREKGFINRWKVPGLVMQDSTSWHFTSKTPSLQKK